MHATRAAVEEGVLPGGGVALLRAIKAGRTRRNNEMSAKEVKFSVDARATLRPLGPSVTRTACRL
jgi:chaperonin GroEL